ncbi:hypothetical protein [Periweissella ghanensis]|uniref:Uncharacterized protein n=1 Tax=Periweissella ghanensis TaxID=467997 RepID=A0ABM8ZB61_9LACO|nr:hypothetical protein [Periweissella ghanensis]MCM0600420.1 hypothetical protein [Periweissella ghanensis]CAH0418116.1 hypothetical protein WGH24286_00532 [Periweissella ghanensis]
MIKTKGYVTFNYDAHMLTASELRTLVSQYQAQLIDGESIIIDELAEHADQLRLILKVDNFTDTTRFHAMCTALNLGDDFDDDTDSYMCEAYGMIFPQKQITAQRALAWVAHYTKSFAKDEFQKFTITKQTITDEALILEIAVELPSYVIDMDLYYLSDQERYQYFRLDDQAPCDTIKEVPINEYAGTHRLELSTHAINVVFKPCQTTAAVTDLLKNVETKRLMPNEVLSYTLPTEETMLISEVTVLVKALGINHQVIQCMLKELPGVMTVEVN